MHKTTRLPVKQSNSHQRTKSSRSLKTKTIKKQQKQKQTPSHRHFSHSTTPTPLDLALRFRQQASDNHHLMMDAVARVKFPSPTQWDLTNSLKRPKIGSKDDLYAILAQNTAFTHSQIMVPKSPHSHIFLPSDSVGSLSSPVAVEYVHQVVELPANLNEVLNEAGKDDNDDDNNLLSRNSTHNKDKNTNTLNNSKNTKKKHIDTLTWQVAWRCQTTQMQGSDLEEYSLITSLSVSTDFHQHFLSLVTKNQQNTSFKPSDLESMVIPNDHAITATLDDILIERGAKLNSDNNNNTAQEQKNNNNNNKVTYMLLRHYGESLGFDDPSFNHVDFAASFVQAWKTYHLSKNNTNNANTCEKSANFDNAPNNTDNNNNPDNAINNNDATKQNSYALLWYSLYAVSHPSNYMWDRLMTELMGIDATEEGFNAQVDGLKV